MAVVSELKLSANQIASIIAQAQFTDADLATIQAAIKHRASKNKTARIVDVKIGDKITWINPNNDAEYTNEVLHVTAQNVTVRLFGRYRKISREKITVVG